MSAARRGKSIHAIRQAIGAKPPELPERIEQDDPQNHLCPKCGKGHLHITDILILPRKAKPPP